MATRVRRDVQYGSLPFDEQIQFFGAKVQIPTRRWTDLWHEAHDTGFMVAGANDAALLADLHTAVQAGINDGETLSQFRKRFDEIVLRRGWDYKGSRRWRTRLIYETNLRTSYAAGRRRQQLRLARRRPYWLYRHSDASTHPRPLHVSWDGLVLPADDPWFSTHYPPNGWGCKCRVLALSERDLERRNLKVGTAPADGDRIWIDKVTGERHVVPRGIDPGWAYAPGASLSDRAREVYRRSALRLPDGLREELLALLDAPPSRTIFLPPPPKPAPWDTETRVGRWHASAWGDAPDWLRDAVGTAGVPSITVVPRGGRSFQQRDHIQIAHKLGESENAAAFWRHEFGHFMDYQGRFLALNLRRPGVQSEYRSARSDFTGAMRGDARALTRDGRPGSARDAGRQIERELSDLSGAADRRARLSVLAEDAGVDLDDMEGWIERHALLGQAPRGSVERDVGLGRMVAAWRRRDAQEMLDAMERVHRRDDGRLTMLSKRNRQAAYSVGTEPMLSDLFDAVTNKRVRGSGQHPAEYYRERRRWGHQIEAWANLASLAGSGGFGEQLLTRFTPRVYSVFQEVLRAQTQ